MTIQTRYQKFISQHGISLSDLGLREIALNRNDALSAIELLRQDKNLILGGDVYLRKQKVIEVALDNWFITPDSNEDVDRFLRRSWDLSEDYIKGFSSPSDKEPLFTIVLGTAFK